MSEIGEGEDLQVSFDRPGEGASLASGEPKRWRLWTRAVLALVAAAAIVVAADRMDNAASPRTATRAALTMAGPYPTEVAPSVRNFVNRVRQLSNGRMWIDMVERPAGPAPKAIEQQVVNAVQTGDADLGWVGTRALDSMGVGGAQAFTAPMLIDSYQLQHAVFHQGLPDRILADLARLSVTGLAVLAGGLDKPVAAEWPLLEPTDWRGVAVETMSSGVEVDAIRSLAATPVHLTPGTPSLARAADTSLLTYLVAGKAAALPHAVANINLWPEWTVLFANPRRLATLDSQQRGWLHAAATDTAAASPTLADSDASLTAPLCYQGARFATATPAQLLALRRAFAPVYRRLSQDPRTGALIADIEALKSGIAAEPLAIPANCLDPVRRTDITAQPDRPGPLDGEYHRTITVAELRNQGSSVADARDTAGTYTLTLHRGRFHLHAICRDVILDHDGRFQTTATRLTLTARSDEQSTMVAWSRQGPNLTFTAADGRTPPPGWTGKPWIRAASSHDQADTH